MGVSTRFGMRRDYHDGFFGHFREDYIELGNPIWWKILPLDEARNFG